MGGPDKPPEPQRPAPPVYATGKEVAEQNRDQLKQMQLLRGLAATQNKPRQGQLMSGAMTLGANG